MWLAVSQAENLFPVRRNLIYIWRPCLFRPLVAFSIIQSIDARPLEYDELFSRFWIWFKFRSVRTKSFILPLNLILRISRYEIESFRRSSRVFHYVLGW